MKRVSTNFLRLVLVIISLAILTFCAFAIPALYKGGSAEFPTASTAFLAIMVALYLMAVPIYGAVWQVFKLLSYIDKNIAFSEKSVRALRNIKYCAVVVSALCMGCVPLLLPIAEADDAPGLVVFGFLLTFAPIAVAVFAAVLQRLLQQAIDIKNENDLTV